MSGSAVARNYASTLLELAGRDGSEERYGELIAQVGSLYREDSKLSRFLETPSVPLGDKKRVLREAFAGAPEPFIRFLMVVIDRRRQRALPGIADAYLKRLDEIAGRVHASITLPFAPDAALTAKIVGALEARFEKKVVPEFHEDPAIVGGMIVRVDDELLDASIRRQLERLKLELA